MKSFVRKIVELYPEREAAIARPSGADPNFRSLCEDIEIARNARETQVPPTCFRRMTGAAFLLPVFLACAGPILAQQDPGEINNGTNPTLLTTQFGIQYQYNQISSDLNTGLFEAFYTQPFGADGKRAFRITVPGSDSPYNANPIFGGTPGNDFTLGDVSLTYIDVFYLTEKNGSAFTFEIFLDTAKEPSAGYGQLVGETSIFYAWFLNNGAIFAPAWVQTFGLEGGNDQGVDVNVSTFDFYYVPKLANPKYYMTFDPAIIHNWENDDTFGSLQITFGMLTGRAFGGDSQVFIKPGVQFGGDAPADWSIQVGYKVLNF